MDVDGSWKNGLAPEPWHGDGSIKVGSFVWIILILGLFKTEKVLISLSYEIRSKRIERPELRLPPRPLHLARCKHLARQPLADQMSGRTCDGKRGPDAGLLDSWSSQQFSLLLADTGSKRDPMSSRAERQFEAVLGASERVCLRAPIAVSILT